MNDIISPGSDWTPLRGVDRRQLSEARLQAHYAAQWLARVARAYVPPQPDDGHTNLGWDDTLDGFVTHPFKGGEWLGLRVTDLTLAFHGGADTPIHSFSLDDHPDAHARRWLGERLDALGLDARALDAASPYELPAHGISKGASYGPAGLTDGLVELAAWFKNAACSLGLIRTQMISRKWAASPVRCWPHHFDLATLTTLPAQIGGTTGSVGCGLSPGDEYYDEPYFYVSVYPEPDPGVLPTLPMLGHWHERDFIAAVATAGRIVAAKKPRAETDDFLQTAIDGAIKVFS